MEFLAFLFFVAFAVFLVRAIQRITRLEEQFRLLHREVKKLATMLPTASSQKSNLLHEISSASADGTQDQEHVIRSRVPAELPPPVYSSGAYSPTVPNEVDETRTAAESADTHVLSDTPAEKSASNDAVEPSTTAASIAEPSPKLANENHKKGSATFKKTEKKLSFEEVLGGKWLAIIGAIAVIIGTGFFFKYAIDQGWVGPLERVLIGVVSGMVTYALGWYAVKKQYLAVGESLVGAAMGMLYFSLFAAHRMYDLLNQDATFAAMALVTTAGFGFAAYFNRQVTAKLGLFGGFVTPFLLAQQLSQGLLFGYLLVLDAGVLFLASYRKWPRVQISSLLATALVWQYWLVARYQPSQLVTTATLMTQFFVLYGLMAVWHNLLKRTPTNKTDIVQIGLVPFLYFAGLYEVTRADYWWLQSSIAVGLAFIYYLVTIYARSVIPNDKGFLFAHAGVAVLFTVVAVPLQWTGHWVTICWAVLSLVFVESAIRIRSRGLLEMGIGLMIVVLLMLLGYGLASIDDPTRFAEHLEQGRYDVPVRFGWSARAVTIPATPVKPLGVWDIVINGRSLSYLVTTVVLGVMAWRIRRAGKSVESLSMPTRSAWLVAFTPVVALFLLFLETFSYGRFAGWLIGTHLSGMIIWASVLAIILFYLSGRVAIGSPNWGFNLFYVLGSLTLMVVAGLMLGSIIWTGWICFERAAWPVYASGAWLTFGANPRGLGFGVGLLSFIACAWLAPWAIPVTRDGAASNVTKRVRSDAILTFGAITVGLAMLLIESVSFGVLRQWLPGTHLGVASAWLGLGAIVFAFVGGWLKQPSLTLGSIISTLAGSVISLILGIWSIGTAWWIAEQKQFLIFQAIGFEHWWNLLFNPRGLGMISVIAGSIVAWLISQRAARHASTNSPGGAYPDSSTLGKFASAVTLFGSLWLVTTEFHWFGRLRDWGTVALLLITIVWAVYGLIVLVAGIASKQSGIRSFALGVFVLTTIKVFLFDVWQLDAVIRTIAFVGLGFSLFIVSWMYRRHRDRIRSSESE